MRVSAWSRLPFIGGLFSGEETEGKPPAKPYRLGLLFVHGMGEQARGDTVTEMGDALTEWLRRWISERGAGFRIRAATLREEGGASMEPSARVAVVMAGSSLSVLQDRADSCHPAT